MKSVVFLFLLGMLATAVTHAQEQVTTTITADRDTLTVGDPVLVTVAVRHPVSYRLQLPALTWDEIELLDMTAPEQTEQGTILRFTITLWAPGAYEIPAMSLALENDAGETITAVTEPLPLTVHSVLTDDDRELRDIRPQAALPPTPIRWQPWLLLALAMGGGTVIWKRRRMSLQKDTPSIPTIKQEALVQLDNLAEPDSLQPERKADYLTAVYHILRQFLQQAYGIPAPQRTTSELFETLAQTALPRQQQAAILEQLQQMDALRFSQQAKMTPGQPFSDPVRRFIQSAPLPE